MVYDENDEYDSEGSEEDAGGRPLGKRRSFKKTNRISGEAGSAAQPRTPKTAKLADLVGGKRASINEVIEERTHTQEN